MRSIGGLFVVVLCACDPGRGDGPGDDDAPLDAPYSPPDAVVAPDAIPEPTLGVDWLQVTNVAVFGAHTRPIVTEHLGELWLTSNGVWHTSDGSAWTAVSGTSAPGGQCTLSFNDKLWSIYGGAPGKVWSSTDGISWVEEVFSAPWTGSSRLYPRCVVWNGNLWMIGNGDQSWQYNDIWSSPDGTTWTQVGSLPTPHAGLILPFDGKLWALGPGTSVRSSTDGINWLPATLSAPSFGARACAAAVADAAMWVICGDKVWTSSDGVSWSEAQPDGPFPPRTDFALTSWDPVQLSNPGMWLIGGWWSDGAQVATLGDVWVSR